MKLYGACIGYLAKKKHRAALLCASAKQREDRQRSSPAMPAEICFEDPTRRWDERRHKGCSEWPDFRHPARGECLVIEDRLNSTGLQAELNTVQDTRVASSTVKPASAEGNSDMTSSRDQVSVEHRWQNALKGPEECNNSESGTFSHNDSTVPRDAFAWTTLISRCNRSGQGRRALRIFEDMKLHGVKPSSYTYVAALKACSSLQDLQCAKKIHAEAMDSGFSADVYVGTMLVDVYSKCGNLADARHVFENMPHRDVVSWSAMIWGYAQIGQGEEAFLLYTRMQQEGLIPEDRTFVGALKACTAVAALQDRNEANRMLVKNRCLEQVRSIHSQIVKSGSESDVFVGTTLVDAYIKCGNLEQARRVFEKMPHRTVVSWNAMIIGYAQLEKGEKALQLFARMQREGTVPDDLTFVGALKACNSLHALGEDSDAHGEQGPRLLQVRAIHSQIMKWKGFELDLVVGNMLVDVYSKCRSLVDARLVFEKMTHRDVVSWNAMILGYAQTDEGKEAFELFARMQREGVVPDDRTYVAVLKACSTLAASEVEIEAQRKQVKQMCLEQVRSIHSQAAESGSVSGIYVGTMLVDAYAKCGRLVDARLVFENIPHHDVFSWNTMILAYAEMEEGEEALQLFLGMQKAGFVPNDRTFVAALKACGTVADLEVGKEIRNQIASSGLDGTDLFVGNGLVDMYGKCGSMVDAQKVFDTLTRRDVVTWNALVAGYARQGESEIVFDLFDRMEQAGIQANSITLLNILNVCSHVGLVDQGKKYFEAMFRDYRITPTIEHYSCMVDLLGRAGQLNQAMEIVRIMPIQPPVEVWRSLLAACRKWRDVELGRHAFEQAVRLDETDAAAYVLMSNIYAAADMQDDAREVHAMRVKAQAWKQPGQSWWTDPCGNVHAFVACDQEHPESQDTYAKLGELVVEPKDKRYIPQLDRVLQAIHDDRKEYALCGHSEKLAVSHALLKTAIGTTIRVMKNRRLCEDCHEAIARISKIEQRTIICRDASRFHVYKDGNCSCRNNW